MAEENTEYKRVCRILRVMGYAEVRPAGSEEWRGLEQVNGCYGTTDETSVHLPEPGRRHVLLEDVESGEPLGRARKPTDGDELEE